MSANRTVYLSFMPSCRRISVKGDSRANVRNVRWPERLRVSTIENSLSTAPIFRATVPD
jgi:hypothetical protein